MKKVFLFFLLFFSAAGYSQNAPPVFGEVSLADLQMKDCPFESGAPAMIMIREEETEFLNQFELNIRVKKWERIKIFNQNGYQFASFKIPYNKRTRLKNLQAFVYNLDEAGNIIQKKLTESDLFNLKEKKKSGYIVFTFPHLKPGSIVEYRYTENEPGSDGFDVKPLQEDIPVQSCLYRLIYHENFQMDITYTGKAENIKEKTEKNRPLKNLYTKTFEQVNTPSFKKEPLMSSLLDNLQLLIVRTSPKTLSNGLVIITEAVEDEIFRWGLMGSRLSVNPHFGIQITKSLAGEEKILDTLNAISEKKAQIEYLYNHVKRKIKWNNDEGIYAEDISAAWNKGIGSSADINFILLNLLKKANFDCSPILVRYRELGKPEKKIVSVRQFNTVNTLITLDSTSYILDGTRKFTSFAIPPYEILNRDALLIKDFGAQWVTIYDNRPLIKSFISATGVLNLNGVVTGEAFKTYYDLSKRFALEEEAKANDKKDFFDETEDDIKTDNVRQENTEDNSLPLNRYFNFTYTPEVSDDYLFISPFFLSPLNKNPFSDSIRRTDIDMGSNQLYISRLHLTFPKEYETVEIPQNMLIRSEDSSMLFLREIVKTDSLLVFKHRLEISKAIFPKESYAIVKEFFQKIFAASKEQLIFKLKK